MVTLQLLVVLVVLLTSDGAKSKRKEKKSACDINAKFCEHVSWADYNNERAIGELLEQKLYSDDFKEHLPRLLVTNRGIKKLLQVTVENKSELVDALRTPLDREVHELFKLRVTCNDGRRNLIVCNETLDFVLLATLNLVYAIEDVADGSQLKEIKKAHENFRPKYLKPPKNETVFETVNVFGSEISRILDTFSSI